MGGIVCLSPVLDFLLEPADGWFQYHSAFSGFAFPEADFDAIVGLHSRANRFCHGRGQPSDLYSWAFVSPRRLVLFSGAVLLKVAAGVFATVAAYGDRCRYCAKALPSGSDCSRRKGTALAFPLDFTGGLYRSLPAQPARPQHSPFLDPAGTHHPVACNFATSVGFFAANESKRGENWSLGNGIACRGCTGDCDSRLPVLLSFPECAQRGQTGLFDGE